MQTFGKLFIYLKYIVIDFTGLAHFTEHAVFMGSQKYPIENAYKQFINQNGGSTNGGTGTELYYLHRNYYFQIFYFSYYIMN